MNLISCLINILILIGIIFLFLIAVFYLIRFILWCMGFYYSTGDIVTISKVNSENLTIERGYVLQNNNNLFNEGDIRCIVYSSDKILIKDIYSGYLHRIRKASFMEKLRPLGKTYEYIQTEEFKNYAERNFE